jgi:hypothetical protein
MSLQTIKDGPGVPGQFDEEERASTRHKKPSKRTHPRNLKRKKK